MGIRDKFERLYLKMQKIIAPSLKYSQTIYEDILWAHSNNIHRWLDLGSGHKLLPPWRLEQERLLVKRPELLIGLDYDYGSLKKHRSIRHCIRGDISRLPFLKESFDLITSNMVFEHLKNPEKQLEEIFRNLQPGGLLIFHTPNLLGYDTALTQLITGHLKAKLIWFLQARKEEDVFPTYYRINTEKVIKRVAERVGFQVKGIKLIVSTAQFIMLPPVAILELILIRLLMTRLGRPFRTNIIAILKKPKDLLDDGLA